MKSGRWQNGGGRRFSFIEVNCHRKFVLLPKMGLHFASEVMIRKTLTNFTCIVQRRQVKRKERSFLKIKNGTIEVSQ